MPGSLVQLVQDAVAGDASAMQGVAAAFSIIAVPPAIVVFIISQIYNILNLRKQSHQYISNLYRDFLNLEISHPRLGLSYYCNGSEFRLTKEERIRKRSAFDLLTNIFELVYLTYSSSILSDRKKQWKGWSGYIDDYLKREDYRDYWITRVMGTTAPAVEKRGIQDLITGRTQFDVRFEAYMIGRLKSLRN